jgi:hypothetical protein
MVHTPPPSPLENASTGIPEEAGSP